MWSYPGYMGLAVLLQDTTTNALRAIHIEDHDEFYDRTETADELEAVFERHICQAVMQNMTDDEARIDVVQFALDEKNPSSLRCPNCSKLLFWRSTGIS